MAYSTTIIRQIMNFVPRLEFDALAGEHHIGQRFRKFSRWTQFVAMATAQLTGRSSLRDVELVMEAQSRSLYHLGVGEIHRSTLARVNERQPHTLYEELFGRLMSRCKQTAPKHGFRFKNPLYSLDSSIIDVCLETFPWEEINAKKYRLRLNVGLNHGGFFPEFVAVDTTRHHEISWARKLNLPNGSVVVFDRGFNDYSWYNQLITNDIFGSSGKSVGEILAAGDAQRSEQGGALPLVAGFEPWRAPAGHAF